MVVTPSIPRIVLGRQTAVPEMILGASLSSRSSFRGASGADVPSSPPESLSGGNCPPYANRPAQVLRPPMPGCPRCARHPRPGRPHARPESRRFPPCQGPPGAVPRRLSARRAAWQRSCAWLSSSKSPQTFRAAFSRGPYVLTMCAFKPEKTVETPTITTIYTYTRARVYSF